jgi:hypothetical protein
MYGAALLAVSERSYVPSLITHEPIKHRVCNGIEYYIKKILMR